MKGILFGMALLLVGGCSSREGRPREILSREIQPSEVRLREFRLKEVQPEEAQPGKVRAQGVQSEVFRPREGDLLFQVNEPSAMTDAIVEATARDGAPGFSHVAIYCEEQGEGRVLEASGEGGVRCVTIEEFLRSSARIDGRPGVVVKRVKGEVEFPVGQAIERARSHIGEPYDYSYRPGNGRMYCSELVYVSYLRADGTPLFTARPMNFRNAAGELPAFWAELFERLGEPVPEGVPGTNPNDMAAEPLLEEVGRYF